MKWIAIKILEYRVRQSQKRINEHKLDKNSILERAFTDANKSYKSAILFLQAEIDSNQPS